MDVADLATELFSRIPPLVRAGVEGLDTEQLHQRPGGTGNSIAWLTWHIGRVEDAQIAPVAGHDQCWLDGGFAARFGLDPNPANTGYAHSDEEVAAVRAEDSAAIVDYLDAVHLRTMDFLAGLTPASLDRVVDERWDPPVTLGVRLVSIADDCLQHAGQAALLRGLLGR